MEEKYSKLSKNALKGMYISTAIGNAILFGIVLAVKLFFFEDKKWATIVLIAVGILCVITMIINPYIGYKRYRYYIDNERIDVKEGIIFIERNIVPIERLHKVTIERGPIDRMLGLGKVLVSTAGGDVTIRYLEIDKAQEIADSLVKKINDVAKESKGEDSGV